MPINPLLLARHRGVSLVELIVFIVVVSIALLALVGVFNYALNNNADPLIRTRALEAAQSKLDEIIALKYDAATPTGGIPACDYEGVGGDSSDDGPPCTNTPETDYNDVDDFDGWSDEPYTNYQRSVSVVSAGNIKTITVSVQAPTGETIRLAAQRANF